MYLARSAVHVHILVRGEGLAATMSSYLSDRIGQNERITVHTHTQVVGLHGEDYLTGVTTHNSLTGEDSLLATQALFIMIGAAPNTGWLDGQVELDAKGFIRTSEDAGPFGSSLPGVYAVGDIRADSVKRVASAVGEGSVVVSAIHRYLAAFADE